MRAATTSARPCQAATAPTPVAPTTAPGAHSAHMEAIRTTRAALRARILRVLSRPEWRSPGGRRSRARAKYQDHWRMPLVRTPRVTKWMVVHRGWGSAVRKTVVAPAASTARHSHTVVRRSVRATRGRSCAPGRSPAGPGEPMGIVPPLAVAPEGACALVAPGAGRSPPGGAGLPGGGPMVGLMRPPCWKGRGPCRWCRWRPQQCPRPLGRCWRARRQDGGPLRQPPPRPMGTGRGRPEWRSWQHGW